MLRSLKIFGISFLVLGIALFFVFRAQSGTLVIAPTTTVTHGPIVVGPPTTNSANGVGPSSRLWAQNWEKGRLVSEFTATECTPSPKNDGSFLVTKPISKFYMTDGQMVKVIGEDGVVYTDNGGPKTAGSMFGSSAQTPRNGMLKKVHIEIYPSSTATRSTTQMDTDNIRFDNDTLRIFADPYTAPDGTVIPADMVPVKVRGEDYELDGTGLTVRWNGVDGHLQLLEIAHGRRLLIKNPSKTSMPGMAPAEMPAQKISSDAPRVFNAMDEHSSAASSDAFSPKLRGDSSRSASVLLVDSTSHAKPVAAKPRPAFPYRAVFSDNVNVKQGDRQVATADVMTIDYLQGSDAAKPMAGSVPVTKSETSNIETGAANTMPAEAGTPVQVGSPTTSPTTKPTTKPTTQPIEIFWTGPLVVKPLESSPPMMPLLPKQSVVRLVGSPAVLTPEGAEARAASATYRTPDGAVKLENSAAFPVVHLTQAKGFSLTTASLNYDPKTQLATLTGQSELTVPLANQKMPMIVRWSRNGVIHTVVPTGQTQPSGADQIGLYGDVIVDHPTFNLGCDELHINLAIVPKPHGKLGETTEQPKLLTAVGNVDCRLVSPGKPEQGIRGDSLAIAMEQSPENKPYPRKVTAAGHVYAFDPDQYLTSDRLAILLTPKLVGPATNPANPAIKPAPTTNPTDDLAGAVQMESLHAESNVHAVMKDNSTADCDELRVNAVDGGKQLVELSGDHGATLNNGKGSSLIGSVIHLAPSSNFIAVDGPGTMHTIESPASASTTKPSTNPSMTPATQPATRPTAPRPVDISWTDSMNVNGTSNTADVVGNVIVHTIDSGGVSTVTGDKAHIDFVDAPKATTKKSAPPADVSAVTMGNKQLKRLTLAGNVHGESTLKDTDGKLLRHAELFGNKMVYTTADHTAIIPGPGRLISENHKPTGSKSPNSTAPANDAGTSQGKMTVVWKKQLVYDQTANVINIDGDTHTHFQQDSQSAKPTEKDQPMELDAQRLVVTLKNEQSAATKTAPKPKPADASTPENGKLSLSHLQAVGAVHFATKSIDFDAHSVDYDPVAQVMTARGSDQEPGETHDADGRASGAFDELVYDVQNQNIISAKHPSGTLRR